MDKSVLEVYKKLKTKREEEEEAYNILNRATSARSYDEAMGIKNDNDLVEEAEVVAESQAPTGDTIENNKGKAEAPAWQKELSTQVGEFGDTLLTVGKSMVSNAAKTIGGAKVLADKLGVNDLTDISADKLLDYAKGSTDSQSKLALAELKMIANRDDRQDDMILQNLYNSITNKTFEGNTDDIKDILERSQKYYNAKFNAKWVDPSINAYEKMKEYNIATYGQSTGGLMNTIGGDVLGPIANTVVTGKVTSLPTAMGLQGTATGEDYMQQRLAQGESYSTASSDVAFETAKGVASGKVFQGISKYLSELFPISSNTVANVLRNVGIGGVSGYGTSVAGKLARNVHDMTQGREVTEENWEKAFWDSDVAMATGMAAILYGIVASVNDSQQVKLNRAAKENEVKELFYALKRGKEIMETTTDPTLQKQIAEQGISAIEMVKNTRYEGVKTNPEAFDKLLEAWKNIIPEGVSYNSNPSLPANIGGSSNVPSVYQTPQTPTGAGTGTITDVSAISQIGGLTNNVEQNIIKPNTNGGMLNENQKQGNDTGREIQSSDGMGSNTRGSKGIQVSPGNFVEKYQGTQKIDLAPLINARVEKGLNKIGDSIQNYENAVIPETEVEPSIMADIKSWENEFGKPILPIRRATEKTGGLTTADKIYIDVDTAKEIGSNYVIAHERGEDLYLNRRDIAGEPINNLIDKIVSDDKLFTKLYSYWLGKSLNPAVIKTKKFYFDNPRLFAKEMVFNAYGEYVANNGRNDLKNIFGDKLFNEISNTLDGLRERAAKEPVTSYPVLNNGDVGSTTYSKQTRDDIINNQKNELVKKEDEIKATEMWSKRTERKKLNKKLDTAKDKIEKVKYDKNEKIKTTKEEGKEKLRKLTSKKNEEKAKAVNAVKEQAGKTIKAIKSKAKEDIKEAKLDAKATDTKKKFKRATDKLEKGLEKVYEKPESKELEKATEQLQKTTRGAIKLINKVKNQIPKDMKTVVDDIQEIVDTYYTGGNKMTEQKRNSLVKKAEAIEKYIEQHPNIPVSRQAIEIIKDKTRKSLSDLNPKDLVDLAENVQVVALDLRDSMSFTRANENAMELRERAIGFVKNEIAKGKGRVKIATASTPHKTEKFMRRYNDFNSNITRITTRVSNGDPNSPLDFIPDRLRIGTTKYFEIQEELLKYFDSMVKVAKVPFVGRKVTNKLDYVLNPKNKLKMTLKTSSGDDYKISVRDAISIVLGRKDLQFAGHTTGVLSGKLDKEGNPMLTEGGEAILGNDAYSRNGDTRRALKTGTRIKLTHEIVDKMEKELSKIPGAKELMDIYSTSGFQNSVGNIINDAYEAITGMPMDIRENYFPVATNTRDRLLTKAEAEQQKQNPTQKNVGLSAKSALLNSSFVKPVVEGANGSIYIYPIDEVINKMIEDASIYGAFATELYDIDTFLNAVDENGVSLRELLDHLDPDYLDDYKIVSNAIIQGSKGGIGINPLSEIPLVGNYTSSILNGNAFLALKQVASLPTAAPFFQRPVRSILQGIFNKHGIAKTIREYYKGIGEDVSKLSDQQVFEKFFSKATTELETRKRGNQTPAKSEILKYSNALKRMEAFGWFKGADSWTVNTLAYAMFADIFNHPEDIASDEYVRELGDQFVKMHYATQPNQAPFTRTLGQLSNNPIAKAFTFMADPRLKQLNATAVARQNYKWARENGTKEEKKKYGGAFAKTIVGALAGLAYMFSLNELQKRLKDKEHETTPKEALTTMLANSLSIYAIGFDQILNRFISKDYNFDVSIPDIDVLNKLYEMANHGNTLMKHIVEGSEKHLYNDAKKVISDLSYVSGLPIKNLSNDLMYMLSATDNDQYYEMAVKEDTDMYDKYLKNEDAVDEDYRTFYDMYKATRDSSLKENYDWVEKSESDSYNSKSNARGRAIRDILGYPEKKQLKGKQLKEYAKWYEIFN